MKKVVIIGAGLAGLSAGYHAQRGRLEFVIYERGPRVGGLCQTVKKDGFQFDYSGHLLHLRNPYFRSLVGALLEDNLASHERKALIYSHGVFTPYPFQANLYGLPSRVVKECLLGFVRAYGRGKDAPTESFRTFHDWIVAKLGVGIGRQFMFPYNKKIWTVPPEELTCEWLSAYVPRPTLEEVFDGAFERQRKVFGYNARFSYPKGGGIQALSNALAERTSNIRLKEKLVRIHLADRVAEFESGRTVSYKALISTVPLLELVKMLRGKIPGEVRDAQRMLRHNSLLILNLGLRSRNRNLGGTHWVYLPEKKFTAYRFGIYSNFSAGMAPAGMSSCYVEIAYRKEWEVRKEDLLNKATADLIRAGLIPKRQDILVKNVLDLEYAYVIYDKNYSASRRTILEFLLKNDIQSIGRYGRWEYSGMEEALTQGKEAVDSIQETR